MAPVNLLELSEDKMKEFLDSFDHVFSDCDGVLWINTPLPGVGTFFKFMKGLGKTVHFVSNNSLRTKNDYELMFQAAGIENGYPDDSTPRDNLIQYLTDDEEIGAVVFDSDFNINLPKIYRALTYLRRPEVHYVNGATDRYVPLKPGSLSLGVGAFSDLVSEESKRKPLILGKPGKMFGQLAMKRAGVSDPNRVLFIGDMIEQDIGLGRAVGFKTLLVLTNTTEEEMLNHKTLQPDFYSTSLGSLLPLLNIS